MTTQLTAQPRPEDDERYDNVDIPSTTFVLDNGLTVIVHENHDAPLVSLNLIYQVGSKDEPSGKTGFAHLFEHLMFEGSENAPGSFLENLLKAGASNLNAYTGQDRTTYHETVPVGSLDYALFMEADRMGHFYSTINQDSLDQQRRVVLNEKLQTESGPYGKLHELKLKGCFPASHPYAHTVIGEVKDLQEATLEDVQNWFRTYYSPSNAVLALSGAIDEQTAREKVTAWFGHIPSGPPLSRPAVWVPDIPENRRDVYQAKVPNGSVMLSWNIPPYGDKATVLLSIAADLFASGIASLLVKHLVYEEKIASHVMANINYAELVSQFTITATAVPGVALSRIEQSVHDILQRFLSHGVDDETLELVKITALSSFANAHKTSAPIAGLLSNSHVLLGNADRYRQIIAIIKQADVDSVRQAAQHWLARACHTLHIVPFTSATTTVQPAGSITPPAILCPAPFQLPAVQHGRLDNGLPLVLIARHSHPTVNIELVLPRVKENTQSEAALLFDLLNQSGAGERDAFEFSSAVRRLSASINVWRRDQTTTLSLSCRPSQLSALLPLFLDRFQHSTLALSDFERQRGVMRDTLTGLKHNVSGMVSRLLPAVMYPQGHPYRKPSVIEGTKASLERVTFENVQQYQSRAIQPVGGTILIVGDTTLEQIVPVLNASIGAIPWSQGTEQASDRQLSPARKSQVFVFDVPGAEQSAIAASTIIPGLEWPHEASFTMLNDVLANGFTSRINLNLRENKNWTYGVHGQLLNDVGSRIHSVQTSVQADRTAAAMQEIFDEYRALLSDRPVTAEELQEVKNAALLRLQSSIEGLGGLNSMLSHLVRYQLPDDHWQRHQERISSTTVDDVNTLAKELFHPETLTWLIAGDWTLIQASIQALALGDIHVIAGNGDDLYETNPSDETHVA
ncbi:pitrilysin family protein [Pectobacterium carotovorum]|uniref:M16 family metallopeptidase n=1 Tax=Pectobacterium versatile TaxID=2488639 RepID=UPI00202D3E30|nr:pitrilysin family protein [Pectobacterium carotovorum]MCL6337348.1 insulinase family protein [Pectobacterium carotovorum subsp. carotovorum]MCL6341604.1 insulinase family protein [Pectobacterium carotovorum subsp. carotovorum]MCL6395780.1 insulinase family protein [Pectobacterium carotovorum subsp. carotovorum]